jgi:REP-associated tyrosine transposase
MPRRLRFIPADSIVHVINRGNDRRRLFESARDYEHFLWLARVVYLRHGLRIIAYVLMPNHWHFVVWPQSEWQVSRYFHDLTGAHAAKVRIQTGTIGHGHIYQDRFRAFIVESDLHYFQVVRYVEANPLAASLVERAQDWRWSSLDERLRHSRALLAPGPFHLPAPWTDVVNDRISFARIDDEMNELLMKRTVSSRTKPIGRN